MPDQSPSTLGIDHVGLTVRDLETTRRFFCECLGWNVVGGRPAYPALFVSDGQDLVTLWQVEAPESCAPFNRRANLGLHHLALKVADRPALDALFARVAAWPGVTVEFAPEPLGNGPRIHCMFYEPGGLRLELACTP
jgi:catechol 2,3-dioxygenase-like lactoylglutathione lyase family enzyme